MKIPDSPAARKWLLGLAAIAVLLAGFWYFTGRNDSGGNQGRQQAAPVRVAKVIRRDMPVVEHTLGTIVANTMVQVTARVQGVIVSAAFREGQFVKQGDLLFQIDPRAFEAALSQARAVLLRDQAQQTNANRDRARYLSLREQGAISEQQRDTSVTNAEMLGATVAADKAAVDIAQLNLGYTQIRSPINGKTGPLLVQPGNMVNANGTAPLVSITQVQPVKLSFFLPQSDLVRIQARQKTSSLIASLDQKNAVGAPLTAPVVFTSNAVSAQSGTIELRASFDNKDLALVPGQTVNVTVELDNMPRTLVVPRDAINDGPDGSYVYVVVDDKAVARPIKILFDDTKNVAVEGALKPGDQVIVEGQLRVEPNGPVRVLGARRGDGPPDGGGGKKRGGGGGKQL